MKSISYNNTTWVKATSVTTGGKEYFYTTHNDDGRFWIMCNRQNKRWDITQESTSGRKVIAQHFRTTEQAMKYFNVVLGY